MSYNVKVNGKEEKKTTTDDIIYSGSFALHITGSLGGCIDDPLELDVCLFDN